MTLWHDIRYAARQLLAAPTFAGIAVMTLALGIGATTAIFSAVYAVILQPFPFPEPDRVVAVGERFGADRLAAVSPGNYEDWRAQATSFSAIGARRFVSLNVSSDDTPERLTGVAVTASYFSVFRVAPALGRTIQPEDNVRGRDRVVVLSNRLWNRMFGSDPDVVGRSMAMDGYQYSIVGVMPAAFDRLGGAEEYWIPVVFPPEQIQSHDDHSMTVAARLAPGVTLEQAAAELSVIFGRVKAQLPDNTQVRPGLVARFADDVIGDTRQRLLVLFGAVTLVLLVTCGNVAHLLLARGRARTHEVALRASLGASRGRLLQQFLAESLLLAMLGGALGVAVAQLSIPILLAVSPEFTNQVPRLEQTRVDAVVLLFAMVTTVLSAIATGIIPAIRASRLDLRSSMNNDARTMSRGKDRVRSVLVVTEVAAAIVLLTGTGLLVRSAIYLQSVDLGFDGTAVLTARVSLPETRYEDPERVDQTFRALVERLSQHPAVESAAVSSSVPMTPGANNNGLVPEGKVFDPEDFVLGRLGLVTEDYFQALRIPLVAGRFFTPADRREAPRVMILSATAAQQLFPGENAVGKRVSCCEPGPDGIPLLKEVVGVVADVRSDGPQADAVADFYLPSQQAPAAAWEWVQRSMTLVVRGRTEDPAALADVVRTAVRETDASVPVYSVATMPQRLGSSIAESRFNTLLMVLLGATGLIVSAIGIYGVIAFVTAQRARELAIRTALGALPRQLVRMVVLEGMRPVIVGTVAGVAVAASLADMLATSVYGIPTRDPLTLTLVVIVLMLAAIAANLLPARAAARINPVGLLGM